MHSEYDWGLPKRESGVSMTEATEDWVFAKLSNYAGL